MVALAAPTNWDTVIQKSVQQKLAQNHIDRGSVLVTVHAGVVTLNGRVATPGVRQRANLLAKRTSGVKSVINDLSVPPIPH